MGPRASGSPNAPIEATPNSAVLPHGRKVVLPKYNAVDAFKDATLAMKLDENSSVLDTTTGKGNRREGCRREEGHQGVNREGRAPKTEAVNSC
jgi:hypothetical protein